MASVFRVTATWQNFTGAPGYSKFSFLEVSGDAGAIAVTAAVRTFLLAYVATLPSGLTIQVSPEVTEHDETTGALVGSMVASTTPQLITGGVVASYAGGAGAFIAWKTGAIWQGRRVQGRTFLAPLADVYEANGTLKQTFITASQNAATGLINDPGTVFAIWAKRYDNTTTPPTQNNGAAFQVLSAVQRDQTSGLRSRRA